MYNTITEEKIKNIPSISDIDIDRLPQDLTKIYAQIVSLRRQITDESIMLQNDDLKAGFNLLQRLANNLETILLAFPDHDKKESIAFVAATANSLIYKMINSAGIQVSNHLLAIDNISPFVAAVVLFLIGNSQADAAEMAISLRNLENINLTQQRLIFNLIALATGKLSSINNSVFSEEEININNDFQEIALNYLWRELGLGVVDIAKSLTSNLRAEKQRDHFDTVIDLSVSEIGIFGQRNVFEGPYRLAKLLKMLENDILNRAIIRIPPPLNVDQVLWESFLENLAKERPYLWENHRNAVNSNFLNQGVSAVLTLPTGAGKSTLSELKIASCVYSGKRIVYLVPTHALEDQVNKNLRKLFEEYEPGNIEYDGEYTELAEIDSFPIIVMTPERCLTLLNIDPNFFLNVGLVVFDEFHLIHGTDIKKDRRSVDAMYCLVSLFTLIPQADYLLISAMVENGSDICEWITKITKRECILFNSTWKPTRQLHGCLVFENKKIDELNQLIIQEKKSTKKKGPSQKLKNQLQAIPECFFSLKNIWETTDDNDYFRTRILDENIFLGVGGFWNLTSNRNQVAAKLGTHFSKLGFKTLIFVDDPVKASSTAETISSELQDRHNNYVDYSNRNLDYIESITVELGNITHSYFYNKDNVGIHHGLLLPLERTLIEGYFKELDGAVVLVATATLAQGINLPAEIVIIAGDDRFDEDSENREAVEPHELLNAAGRAGRAGQSSQGAVILVPGDIVVIENSTISERWWDLKNRVFSKGDQCLKIEDPLQYFLDSLQDMSIPLDNNQTNILYRFKSQKLSENDTKNIFKNSFYAFKSEKEKKAGDFNAHLERFIERRNELDSLSENYNWVKEISFKTSADPSIILELSNAIDKNNFEQFISRSIIELIDWFFEWLQSNEDYFEKIFIKPSTINQIKRTVGLKQDTEYKVSEILNKISTVRDVLKHYVQGLPLNELNDLIPNTMRPDRSVYLKKARNFVIRLVPELSFSFGILSFIIIEKALQKGLTRETLPWNIRVLASCIREGFDISDKLFFKKNNKLLMRVETHVKFSNLPT